jgi:hypothetical protein
VTFVLLHPSSLLLFSTTIQGSVQQTNKRRITNHHPCFYPFPTPTCSSPTSSKCDLTFLGPI